MASSAWKSNWNWITLGFDKAIRSKRYDFFRRL